MDVLGLEEVAVRDIPGDFVKQAGFGGGDLRLQALKFGDIPIKLLEWDGPAAGTSGGCYGVRRFALIFRSKVSCGWFFEKKWMT